MSQARDVGNTSTLRRGQWVRSEATASQFYRLCKLFGVSSGYVRAGAEAATALAKAGFASSTIDDLVNIFHMSNTLANARNFRSAGNSIDGSGSGHFTVWQRVINDGHFIRVPLSAVPTSGDLHLGEHNPWRSVSAFRNHARELMKHLGF